MYWLLTEPSIKRCTGVNKRKKKREQVDVMKEHRQMLVAVEEVGWGSPEGEPACRLRAVAHSDLQLSNPSQDVKEVPSGFLEITQSAMVKRRSWVNIAVCPCLHSSLTHHRNINPFENKEWEIHIFFIKKCVRSFIELCKSCKRVVYNNSKPKFFLFNKPYVVDYIFKFCKTNVFGCFCRMMAPFELV